jgi:hypothetical protein
MIDTGGEDMPKATWKPHEKHGTKLEKETEHDGHKRSHRSL